MADITASVPSWSTTESLNAPLGTAIAGAGIDDNLRAIQAGVKKAVGTIGANLIAGGTTDLSGATGNTVNILGTASISSLGTVASGSIFKLIFASACTLVNSANLVLPGGTNISVQSGDVFEFTSRGSGAWTCTGATPNVSPGGLPVGAPIPWFTAAVPVGYHLCAGQVINRTVYSALFGVLGTTYNTGGKAGTEFRLPDLRGRFLAGLNNMGGSAAGRIQAYATATAIGNVGGNEYPQSHAHSASSGNALSIHSHTFSGSTSGSTNASATDHYHAYSGTTAQQNANASHTHGIGRYSSSGALQSGFPGGDNGAFVATNQTDAASTDHGHVYSGNTAYQSATGFANWEHTHLFSAEVSGSNSSTDLTHNHGVTVNTEGSGASGNIPPVMFVNWIIRAY